MELELGLALPNPHQPLSAGGGELVGLLGGSAAACGKKRVFGGDAFGAANKATLLTLFVPEDGDGGGGDRDGVDHEPSNK